MKNKQSDLSPARPPSLFATVARDAGPVWLGMFALGVGLGVLVTSNGLPWWLAPIISGTVYAGSVEFLLVGMLAAAAPLSAIAVTTLLVNSRHVFYGLSFPLHRVRGWRKAYSVYTLSDEAYALVTSHDAKKLSSGWILCMQAGLHLSWVSGSVVGAVAGATFLNHLAGLDFILTALFIVLAMDAYRNRPDKPTVGAALVLGAAAAVLAGNAMLLVAMTAFTIACVVRHAFTRRRVQPKAGACHGA